VEYGATYRFPTLVAIVYESTSASTITRPSASTITRRLRVESNSPLFGANFRPCLLVSTTSSRHRPVAKVQKREFLAIPGGWVGRERGHGALLALVQQAGKACVYMCFRLCPFHNHPYCTGLASDACRCTVQTYDSTVVACGERKERSCASPTIQDACACSGGWFCPCRKPQLHSGHAECE
jgi:hypothetical protein